MHSGGYLLGLCPGDGLGPVLCRAHLVHALAKVGDEVWGPAVGRPKREVLTEDSQKESGYTEGYTGRFQGPNGHGYEVLVLVVIDSFLSSESREGKGHREEEH